jgi:glycosyltransferase involved in cell wall biosynthesis
LKILHISNDYAGSKVYRNLISNLDKLGIEQVVYCPIRTGVLSKGNKDEFSTYGNKVIFSEILNYSTDRLFYRLRIKKIYNDLLSKIDVTEFDLIHSHTWFSDGGVANLISEKYNIPYLITIRNTDLNIYYKYLFFERNRGFTILDQASQIILISPSYSERLSNELPIKYFNKLIKSKISILPNGIDDFWIRNYQLDRKTKVSNPVKCLFIGKFYSVKNIMSLQKAIIYLNSQGINIVLHLIGGTGDHHDKVLSLIKRHSNIFIYHGEIYCKQDLKKLMVQMDFFAMPSIRETFGLVYIESLLQGLPVLYTKGEGIDRAYEDRIGEAVSKNADYLEIAKSIIKLIDNYSAYSIPTEKLISNHDWSNISKRYKNIYEVVINDFKN